MNLTEPLSPARARLIRIHLALIPVYGWLLFVWTSYAIDIGVSGRLDRSGHIKGHDFAHFYVLGQIANDQAAGDLYSFEAQGARMDRLLPHYENRFAPIHGPQMALLFSPLARLPYETAVTVWLLATAAGYAAFCWMLWASPPRFPRYTWVAVILAAGYPAFYQLIAFGQNSVLALACVTGGYLALRKGQPWIAGLALGSLIYKPVFGFALPFVFLYGREWRVIAGAIIAIVFQLGAGAAWFGPESLAEYFSAIRNVGQIAAVLEPIPYQMQSLRSFFTLLIPSPAVAYGAYLATAAGVIIIAARHWGSGAPLELRYSVLLLATVLVDPHVNPYDLVVIIPVFILVAKRAIARGDTNRWLWGLLCLCYYLPALTFIPTMTHVQVSVAAMAALMIALISRARA